MTIKQYKLFKELISLSVSANWNEAKDEWFLDHIYDAEEAKTCICGHYPILQICVIKNRINSIMTFTGNCCIKHITGDFTKKMFVSLKKVEADIDKSLSIDFVILCYKAGYIDNYELEFYKKLHKKRIISDKQIKFKIALNEKILFNWRKNKL